MQHYLCRKAKTTPAAVFANINTKQRQLNVAADNIITVVKCNEYEACNKTETLMSLAYISLILYKDK